MSGIIINPYVHSPAVYDADAQAMFNARAIFSDDPAPAYKQAISDYVTELKAVSGLWARIIQLVVFAGATTIAGATRSIKGSNLTSSNFNDADVNPGTGVKGDGAARYFDAGYTGLVAGTGQNNFHTYAYISEVPSATARALFGRGGLANGAWQCNYLGATRAHNGTVNTGGGGGVGGYGLNRSVNTSYQRMAGGTVTTVTQNSQAPNNARLHILANSSDGGATPSNYSDARILVWALGQSVSLGDYATPTANLVAALNAI